MVRSTRSSLPSKWNGTLLLYSHGYRPPARAAGLLAVSRRAPRSIPPTPTGPAPTRRRQQLLAEGYAFAGSAYKSNGWAVADGVKAGEELHYTFVSLVGTPQRTYVWGDSLGGLITEIARRAQPAWVDGAAPMCGAVAGPNLNFDAALDVAYAIKTLIDPTLKLTGYTSAEEAVANWKHAAAAVEAAAADTAGGGTAKALLIGALVDAPLKTQTYDGSTITRGRGARRIGADRAGLRHVRPLRARAAGRRRPVGQHRPTTTLG